MYRVAIITLSDSGSKGEREDVSGKVIEELVKSHGMKVELQTLLSDDAEPLTKLLCKLCDEDTADLILTTGGTGFSKRDNTPEATLKAIEKNANGIAEALRYCSLQITPRGMLSRGVAGIRKDALIVNLPGSPKAVRECLEYGLGSVIHGLDILKGTASNCARK